MDIKLDEKEVIVILDALVEALAFDNNADDIKVVYNKIVKQTNMDKYEMLGQINYKIKVTNQDIFKDILVRYFFYISYNVIILKNI